MTALGFQCGEYGDELGRPHHHALLFNCDFPDKRLHKDVDGTRLFKSQELNEIWGYGHAWIGAVTFESAGYVARYALKKVTGAKAVTHYQGLVPEYATMSRRPGIGAGWYERYRSDVYPSGVVVLRGGVKARPPRFYDNRYEAEFPEDFFSLKAKRKFELENDVDSSGGRLIVREECATARTSMLLTRRIEG